MIKQKLKEAEKHPYIGWFREQLKITNTKVQKWSDWNDEMMYEAYVSSRRVHVPIPIDSFSFLVALHEIGHISTGERLYSYLSEYNSEKWAMRRAKEAYNVVDSEYEEDAKLYVLKHLVMDLLDTELTLPKVKPYVKEWIGLNDQQIAKHILKLNKNKQLHCKINVEHWKSIANGKHINTITRNSKKGFRHNKTVQRSIQRAKRATSFICSYLTRSYNFFSRHL